MTQTNPNAAITDGLPDASEDAPRPWVGARATSYGRPLSDAEMWAIVLNEGVKENLQIKEIEEESARRWVPVMPIDLGYGVCKGDYRLKNAMALVKRDREDSLARQRRGEPRCQATILVDELRLNPRRAGDRATTSIYFILAGQWVKIGRSDYVRGRLQELQTLHPETVLLLGSFVGVKSDEAFIHRYLVEVLGEERGRGEWFRMSETIATVVSALCIATPPSTNRR